MNGKDLLMGLGHVDEAYIQAAEEKTLRKPFGTVLRRYGAMAACFAVLIVATTVFYTRSPVGPTPPGPVVALPDISQPPEFVSEEVTVDMKQVYFNDAIGSQEDIWYDPEVYTITSLTGQALTDYYQRDLTPLWLPDGLTPSKQNGRAEQVIAADGAIVSDMVVLDFYSGFQDDNLPELYEDTNAAKGLSLSVSRLGRDYVLPEQERQTTDIDGVAVTLGVSIRPCEPAGTVEVINAEWESGGLHFQLTAQQIERTDVVKTIASIITGTMNITIIN
ncbi:hypothetical protein AALA83_17095 [Oscillospiraceae bacterium 44-5]